MLRFSLEVQAWEEMGRFHCDRVRSCLAAFTAESKAFHSLSVVFPNKPVTRVTLGSLP